jgi:hypothetical protein
MRSKLASQTQNDGLLVLEKERMKKQVWYTPSDPYQINSYSPNFNSFMFNTLISGERTGIGKENSFIRTRITGKTESWLVDRKGHDGVGIYRYERSIESAHAGTWAGISFLLQLVSQNNITDGTWDWHFRLENQTPQIRMKRYRRWKEIFRINLKLFQNAWQWTKKTF